VAHLEDADLHLSRQSRREGGERAGGAAGAAAHLPDPGRAGQAKALRGGVDGQPRAPAAHPAQSPGVVKARGGDGVESARYGAVVGEPVGLTRDVRDARPMSSTPAGSATSPTRRSIEETAAQILNLMDRRGEGQNGNSPSEFAKAK